MTMYFHWTCINVNRKDVHASMISFNGKYINNMGAYHGFEKNEIATMCFFLKLSLVTVAVYQPQIYTVFKSVCVSVVCLCTR